MSTSVPSTIEGVKDRLQLLIDRFSDVEKRLDAYARWKSHTNERIGELEEENAELRNRLGALEARLDVVESGDTGKEGKLRQIVAGAENVRTGEQTAVVMEASKIVTVTGVSRRYAYNLIDDLPDQYHWILSRDEARQQQYGSAEIYSGAQSKGLVIDFERLHNDPRAVNKFTTTREGEDA